MEQVKFRVVPAGPPFRTRPTSTAPKVTLEMLQEDLALSDSTYSAPVSETSSGERIDYKELGYVSVSTTTICMDEEQSNTPVTVNRVYEIRTLKSSAIIVTV